MQASKGVIVLLALVAGSAQAQIYTGSGLITITQTNASGSGIGPGDSPGYPVTITNPGSYKLGSNLSPPSGVDAIDISADYVTLDLNGCTITGFDTCSIVPPNLGATCAAGSWGEGVYSTGAQTTVKNGSVNGFSTGVDLGGDAGNVSKVSLSQDEIGLVTFGFGYLVDDVQAFRNGTGIILLGPAVQARNITVAFNGNYGLRVAANEALVSGVTATSNDDDGIEFEVSGILSASASTGNSGNGVSASGGPAVITDIVASSNGANGFAAGGRSLLLELNAVGNAGTGYGMASTDCYYHVAGESNSTNLTGGTALTGTTCF